MTEDKSRPTLRQTDFLPARFSGTRHDRDDTTAHFFFTDYNALNSILCRFMLCLEE